MNLEQRIARWAVSDDTGLSSQFLAACVLGDPDLARISHPCDPSDFGRCYRLTRLLTTTELTEALILAGGCSKEWAAVAANWGDLCEMYEAELTENTGKAPRLYKRMKELGL
jgi:hypothetical protein